MSCMGRNDDPVGKTRGLEDYLAIPLSSIKSVSGLVLRTSVLYLCFSKVFDNVHGVILIKQRHVVLIMTLKDGRNVG